MNELNLDSPWGKKGRPSLLDSNDIDEIVNDVNLYSSKSIGNQEITDMMKKKKVIDNKAIGTVSLMVPNFKPSSNTFFEFNY